MRTLLICLSVFMLASYAAGGELEKTIDTMIKAEIEKNHARYKESKKPPKEGEEQVIYSERSYKAGIAFLTSLLKAKDLELKKNYLLTLLYSELDFEEAFLDFMEEDEKKQAEVKVKELKNTVAKLKQDHTK